MPAAGNSGSSVAADKAQAKAKRLKRLKPVATGSRGDSGTGRDKPTKPIVAHAPGPPNFPKKIPVRPGAQVNRFKSKPTTQAQRTHVHKERIKRNLELLPAKQYVSTGKAVEAAANKANAKTQAQSQVKGSLAKKYAKKNPELFTADKKQLKLSGFSTDQGVRLTNNAFKDLIAIGQTPVSTYHLAEPIAKDLAKGDIKGAGKEAGKTAKTIAHQYTELYHHPGREFMRHPVFTGLNVAGVEGAVGRAAGAAGRSGALGSAAKAAASTERASKVLPGTSLVETKKYSPDIIRKGVARANEKRKAANESFRVARGHEPSHPTDIMTPREIHRRMDERIAVNEDIRRQNREKVIHEASKALKGGHESATSLIAQGVVKADKADIQTYIHELEHEHNRVHKGAAEKYATKHMGAKVDSKGDLVVKAPSGRKGILVHRVLTDKEIRDHAKAHGEKLPSHLTGQEKWANRKLREELQKVVDDPKVDLSKAKAAGEKYGTVIGPRSEGLIEHGMLNTEQAQRAALIPHAIRYMGAKHVPDHWENSKGERVTDHEVQKARKADPDAAEAEYTHVDAQIMSKTGKPLPTSEILKHYNAHHGLPADNKTLPVFVTHRARKRGNFNIRSENAPSMGTGVRTGRSVSAGLLDPSHDALIENAARIQGLKDAAEGYNGILKEFGAKDKGELVTRNSRKEAQRVADAMRFDEHGNPVHGAPEMVPVRLKPFGGSDAQLQSLIEKTRGDEFYGSNSPIRQAIEDAVNAKDGEGPWALIPRAAHNRINEHLGTMGRTTGEQAVQAASGLFRKTVLSTSPTWLWGNVAEAALRSTVAGSGPIPQLSRSFYHGRAVLRELAKENPELAQEIAHRVAGGGHFSTAARLQVFRTADQFAGTALGPVAKKMSDAVNKPGAKTIARGWNAWTSHVFKFNSTLERHYQTAMFGKALKKDGMRSVEDAVNGLRGTEAQVRFGRQVDDMYGKYSKWSPSTRHYIATYTPFISWWLAAAKFVFHVLPRDHPVLTSLLATSNLATEKWRKEQKINLDQLGIKAGFLAGSLPVGGGKHVNIARYTPFGAFTNPADVANTILPQISTLTRAGLGEDWKGHDLKFQNFANDLAGAYIPFFQRGEAVKKYGPTGSLNPYRKIKPGKKGGGGGISKPAEYKFDGPSDTSGYDWSSGGTTDGAYDWGG